MQIKRTKTYFAAGFTLLELIIAIALMNVIAVALYSSMRIGFKTKESIDASLEPYRSVKPIFEFIRKDLTSAMNPDGILAGAFVGENVPFGDMQDADTLSFYSTAYQPKEGEIASNVINVEYGIGTDYERDQVVLKRFTEKNILTPTAIDPDEEVIGRNITGFDIQYFDGSSWLDTWDSSEQDNSLPWGVKVTISILDENRSRYSQNDDPYRYFSRIFLLPFGNQDVGANDAMQQASGGPG
ncbi:MAG: prepilin-type N-terminal cleavage/methylation domain-containing protein [Planctomycetes bacterium]|nr:prepilin-type N-terminal cleavage/methylation domain-containing protein [Planctomycetota bacterium]